MTLHGTTMYGWGITEESGCLLQSHNRDVGAKTKAIANHEGDTVAKSIYDLSASYTLSAYPTGASLSGIVDSDVGAAVTLAGTSTGNGVSTGLIICEGVSQKENNEDYVLVDLTLMQHEALV